LWLLLEEDDEETISSLADGGVQPSLSVEIVTPTPVVGSLVTPLQSTAVSTSPVSF